MNKIIKCAAVGFCSTVLVLGSVKPVAAETFVQCDNYINIHQDAYLQSPVVGYIYDDNIIENIQQEKDGWIKITSGSVEGWIDKNFITESESMLKGYTVAIIHPENLSVYISPDKDSTIYTTVYQGQEIECVEYKDDWLTVVFEDGFYGFIDAYQAELKTYYGEAEPIQNIDLKSWENIQSNQENIQSEEVIPQQVYGIIDQSNNEYYQEKEQVILSNEIINPQYPQYQNNYNYNYDYNYNEYYEEENYNVYMENENYQEEYGQEIQGLSEEYNTQQYQQHQQQLEEYNQQYQYENEEQQQEEQYNTEQESNNNLNNSDIVSYADQFVGNPYVYGGNSLTDGIDCSHFVWQVLTNTGHYDGGYAVSDGWMNLGDQVDSLDNAVAGDVIVYPGHVAIYDGEGGIVEAKGSEWGITHDRSADSGQILAIRHFD